MGIIRVLALVVLIGGVIVAAVVVGLRIRKLRRDEIRQLRNRNAANISPPPSPYEVSRGVRRLDGDSVPESRPQPARPRLDPDRAYVFSDATPFDPDVVPPSHTRHDDRWALERSSHRSRLTPGSGRVLVGVVLALVLLLGLGAYIQHSSPKPSTTTTTSTTTTSTTLPAN